MEKLSHGRPSGCDAATVIHGDCLVYKVGIPPNLTEVIKLPKAKIDSMDMFIVNTNAAKNTKDLVSRVKTFKDNQPEEFGELMNTLRDVTSELVELLQE